MYYIGTLMANRKNSPPEIKNSKMKHLETKYVRNKTEILLCMRRDKKEGSGGYKYTWKSHYKTKNDTLKYK